MPQIMITLNQIRSESPCEDGWKEVLSANGGTKADYDKPFPLSAIVDSNGIYDALWCIGAVLPEHHMIARRFALWCANQVRHLMVDERSIVALDVAERYLDGKALRCEVAYATRAACDASCVSSVAASNLGRVAGDGDYSYFAYAEAAYYASCVAYLDDHLASIHASDAAFFASDADRNKEKEVLSAQAAKLKACLDAGKWV